MAEGAPLLREYLVYSRIEGSNPSLSAIISLCYNGGEIKNRYRLRYDIKITLNYERGVS